MGRRRWGRRSRGEEQGRVRDDERQARGRDEDEDVDKDDSSICARRTGIGYATRPREISDAGSGGGGTRGGGCVQAV